MLSLVFSLRTNPSIPSEISNLKFEISKKELGWSEVGAGASEASALIDL